jgi:hypothetical protein
MPGTITPSRFPFTLVTSLVLMMVFGGCASMGASVLEDRWSPMKSIVVVGFVSVLTPGDESQVVRGPLHGAVYTAQPVREEISDKLTEVLLSAVEGKGYDLISPGQAKGVLASLYSSSTTMDGIQLYQKVGKTFSADGILVGYLYRWVERQGADYAVNTPASVAFDLFLLRSADGAVTWRGKFDKTQQSFFENLLDLDTFLKSKGRWVRAETLAEMGLNELMEKFPQVSAGPRE